MRVYDTLETPSRVGYKSDTGAQAMWASRDDKGDPGPRDGGMETCTCSLCAVDMSGWCAGCIMGF